MTTSLTGAGAPHRARRSPRLAMAIGSALLASTCLTLPAMAQTSSAPPAYRNLDANGVDLTHGDYVFSFTEGTIGSGEAELALVRSQAGSQASAWDNIYLNESRNSSGQITAHIRFGNRWDRFTGPNFTSAQANGSSLATSGNNYVHTAADGTTITFTARDGSCAPSISTVCQWMPTEITDPSDKKVTLVWDRWFQCGTQNPIELDPFGECTTTNMRLAEVSNSFGYRIDFSYAHSGFGGSQPPPSTWFQRTSARFTNSAHGTTVQASVSYAYPASNITDVTDTAGNVWRITGQGNIITGLRRPGASSDTTVIAYSGSSVSSVTTDGVTTNYARNVSGTTATTTVTNPLSQQSVIVSDMNVGRPVSVTDPLNRTTSFQYDSYGRMMRMTRPEGDYTQFTLDARGNVTQTQQIAKSGSGAAAIVTTAAYPATCTNPVTCNLPTATTDARGNVTDYTWDATHGGLVSVTLPAPTTGAVRPQTRFTYTLLNGEYLLTGTSACQTQASCTGTADEVKATIVHDANGNAISVSRGAGDGSLTATTAMSWDARGNLTAVDGPVYGAEDTVRYRYDAARRPIGTIAPDPDGAGPRLRRAERVTYNAAGQVLKTEAGTVAGISDTDWANFTALEAAETGYDAYHRPVTQRLVAGGTTHAVTQLSYDAAGRPECTAQRMNPAAFGSLPASACTLGTEGSFGPDRISKAVYDAAGQAVQSIAAVGTALQAVEAAATYTTNGNLHTLTDAEGNLTTYAYNGHDRLARTTYPSPTTDGVSNAADYEELGYDPNGNVVSRRLRDGTSIAYTYDALNRMTLKDIPNGAYWEWDTAYSYDNLGRLTGMDVGWYNDFTYVYDALGHLGAEYNNQFGTKSLDVDAAGRLINVIWPDGTYANYEYDVAGQVTAIRENGGLVLASFAYDDLGRRTSITRGNGTVTNYSYDPVSRLASLSHDIGGTAHDVTFGFSYNPASQIAGRTSSNDAYAFPYANQNVTDTHDGLNRIAASGAIAPTYDARGNLTNDGVLTYRYTSENRLATAGPYYLPYGPNGRLWEVYHGTNRSDVHFDYVGDSLVTERSDSTWATVRRYVYGPGVDEPLVWYEGSGTSDRRWLHADERGSIVAISDGAGNAIAINSYDDYGNPASTSGGVTGTGPGGPGILTGRFGYTGQIWHPEISLYDYKNRFYSPGSATGNRVGGRFLQTDPIGYEAGMNLYAYVGGDPINMVDPWGLQRCYQVTRQYSAGLEGYSNSYSSFTQTYCFEDRNEVPSRGGFGEGGGDRISSGPANGPSPGEQGRPCQSNARTWTGAIRDVAGTVATIADTAALGFGAATIATAPTVGGGLTFGVLTVISKGIAAGAGIVEGIAAATDGDVSGAASSALGAAVGRISQRGFNTLRKMENINGRYGEIADEAIDQATAAAIGSAACSALRRR